ncbi:MAG: hypothetical protein R3E94_03725 [Burkholderiaceae bacterium]
MRFSWEVQPFRPGLPHGLLLASEHAVPAVYLADDIQLHERGQLTHDCLAPEAEQGTSSACLGIGK